MPKTIEYGAKATADDTKELKVQTLEESHQVCVIALLSPAVQQEYFQFLSEYKDVLEWSYK